MLVLFDSEPYIVLESVTCTRPKGSRKRKLEIQTIFNGKDELTVARADCEPIDIKIERNFAHECCEWITTYRSNYKAKCHLQCSYEGSEKTYHLDRLLSVSTTGLVVELTNGDIRNFKWTKIHCTSRVDGLVHGEYDD